MSRDNYIQECAGLRVVEMFTVGCFHWGWQQYSQENDDGIDGEIIVRDHAGNDLGCKIYVQIKSGSSYCKGIRNDLIHVVPYGEKKNLVSHLEKYKRYVEPVILVFVDSPKIGTQNLKLSDMLFPKAWWVQLNQYDYDNTAYVYLPKSQRFSAQSKGDLFKLVRPILRNWSNYPLHIEDTKGRRLWNDTTYLRINAHNLYKQATGYKFLFGEKRCVLFSRMGWRHINSRKRGREKIITSLKLIPEAIRIVNDMQCKELVPLKKRSNNSLSDNLFEEFYGIRSRYKKRTQDSVEIKVQVVLRRLVDKAHKTEQWCFYSVHSIR